LPRRDFPEKSALGISIQRILPDDRVATWVAFENRRGLPEVFNARIAAAKSDAVVFVHDDVWIEDYYLLERVIEGLKAFDVIGVAGNRRRVKNQPTWAHVDDDFTRDEPANLSGRVSHGPYPMGPVTLFGEAPAQCELLDGVFLAARRSALLANDVLFDPKFDFHFYDMDFCRTARAKGLRLGTWPICLTHQSAGNAFGGPSWIEKRNIYREKWKD
jgi:GT2 family glycosyltransferase